MEYFIATEGSIPFISQTYDENIDRLHGNHRTADTWKTLLADENTEYYIVREGDPVAWFRVDLEDGGFWLGMLQVKPSYQRKGVGKYILSVAEDLAKAKGFQKIGVHTTEDNLAARALYLSAGYCVTEIGPCTTADGVDRVGYTFEKEL